MAAHQAAMVGAMLGIRNKALACLGIFAVGAVAFFLASLPEQGWPGSALELLLRLGAAGFAGLITFGFYLGMFYAAGRRFMLGFALAVSFAGVLAFGLKVNGWVATGVALVLTFLIFRAYERSALFRMAAWGVVAAAIMFLLVGYVLSSIAVEQWLIIAAVAAVAFGVWTGWAWRLAEGRSFTGWSRKRLMTESMAAWRRNAAAEKDQISADDFLNRRS